MSTQQMTPEMIQKLRDAYSQVETVDPCGEGYAGLCRLLDSLDDKALIGLAVAKVKFVSKLARNRVVRRGLCLRMD